MKVERKIYPLSHQDEHSSIYRPNAYRAKVAADMDYFIIFTIVMPQMLWPVLLAKRLKQKVIKKWTINGIASYKDQEWNLYSLNVSKNGKKWKLSKEAT